MKLEVLVQFRLSVSPFSRFLPLDVLFLAVGDILRHGCCRCVVSVNPCNEQTYSDHSWGCLSQPWMKHCGEGILKMEDVVTSEEEDTSSQDFSVPMDHGHLAWNCLMKIKMSASKALIFSLYFPLFFPWCLCHFILQHHIDSRKETWTCSTRFRTRSTASVWAWWYYPSPEILAGTTWLATCGL